LRSLRMRDKKCDVANFHKSLKFTNLVVVIRALSLKFSLNEDD
jgi:hypothetical protein